MIILDTNNYELVIDEKVYSLSQIPYKLLLLLSNNKICTKKEIIKKVYDIDIKDKNELKIFNSSIAVTISRLRKYRFKYKSNK